MTIGMNKSCNTIRFKITSHTVDTLRSSSLSIMEVDDSASAIASNPDHKVPCTIIECCVQPKPYTFRLYV
jgi:hypothetical protein